MSGTVSYVIDRARESRSAQSSVASSWVWEELTVADWDALITGLQSQLQAAAAAEATMLGARGALDNALSDLHQQTVLGIRMARVRFKKDPAASALLNRLSAAGGSRARRLQEAMDWEAVWKQLDATWSPTSSCTFACFQALRTTCVSLDEAYTAAVTAWRSAVETLKGLASTLHDYNIRWYAAATAVFPADTPEGAVIRSTVTTLSATGDASSEDEDTSNSAESGSATTADATNKEGNTSRRKRGASRRKEEASSGKDEVSSKKKKGSSQKEEASTKKGDGSTGTEGAAARQEDASSGREDATIKKEDKAAPAEALPVAA